MLFEVDLTDERDVHNLREECPSDDQLHCH